MEEIVGGSEVSHLQPPSSLHGLTEVTNLSVEELEEIESLLRSKKQLILEGPPGAGKTYLAELFARYFTGNPFDESSGNNLQIIQFHQSYGYEDFIQGIRPETNTSGQLAYWVRPGVFKAFCDEARKSTKPFVFVIDEINRGNISRIFGELLFLLEYRDRQVPLPFVGLLAGVLEAILADRLSNVGSKTLGGLISEASKGGAFKLDALPPELRSRRPRGEPNRVFHRHECRQRMQDSTRLGRQRDASSWTTPKQCRQQYHLNSGLASHL